MALLLGLAQPAGAAVRPLPGELTGEVLYPRQRGGETPAWVAVRHGVHPVRVTRSANGRLRVDTRRVTPRFGPKVNGVVLNVPECHVYLVHDGRVERDYPVAVSTPDRPVPLGTTQVVSKEKNPTWVVPASIQKEMASRGERVTLRVPPGPGNPLGPRWIGFWKGQFGMHGTNAPTSIKRYASHGCVRFRGPDIVDLYNRVWLGTPVHIVYEPVLLAVDAKRLWLSVYPDIYTTAFDYAAAVRRLARQRGVLGRLDWARVRSAIAARDGIVRQVQTGSGEESAPPPERSPRPARPRRPVNSLPRPLPTRVPVPLPETPPLPSPDDAAPAPILELVPFGSEEADGPGLWERN